MFFLNGEYSIDLSYMMVVSTDISSDTDGVQKLGVLLVK